MAKSPAQQCRCVNVDPTSATSDNNLSPHEMLDWVNDCLQSQFKEIEELSDGAAYAQFMDMLFPGTVPLEKIEFRPTNLEQEYITNFKFVQMAFNKVGCDKEIPVNRLVKARFQDNLEFLRYFRKFFDANYDGHEYNALEARGSIPLGYLAHPAEQSTRSTLALSNHHAAVTRPASERTTSTVSHSSLTTVAHQSSNQDTMTIANLVECNRLVHLDHSWSKKILELIGNKAKLMESFSWLSTVGGGFSALGETDPKFSRRAGALSLGQQLYLAESLGDERLKVMCHLFAALAALQMNNREFVSNYIDRIILPLISAMPYRDAILINILKHIRFRLNTELYAIEYNKNSSPKEASQSSSLDR